MKFIGEQTEKILNRIPLFTAIIYITGYISFSLHVSRFGVEPNEILDIQYLRTGVLIFLLALVPVLSISFNYKNKTDNLSKTKHLVPALFHRTFEISWITIIILNYDKFNSVFTARGDFIPIGLNRCAVFITMLDHNKPNPALYLPCCFSQILSAS